MTPPYWQADAPSLDQLAGYLAELDRTRPLVLVPPGVLDAAHLHALEQLGAEVRESELAPPGHLLWVNRAALERATSHRDTFPVA